jgi:hypothetical protein
MAESVPKDRSFSIVSVCNATTIQLHDTDVGYLTILYSVLDHSMLNHSITFFIPLRHSCFIHLKQNFLNEIIMKRTS